MFKKLLNVGKGNSSERLQQQQQQQKSLFQLNEIRSYGFSHHCCLGQSDSLSLLAVGSKNGLLRVLGNPSVEFTYQLETRNAIKQIEFIDCRDSSSGSNSNNINKGSNNKKQQNAATQSRKQPSNTPAKLVVLTDNGQLHLFELRTIKQLNVSDNTTQTEALNGNDCFDSQTNESKANKNDVQQQTHLNSALEYTKLEHAGVVDYFKFKLDDDDRSRRVTTLEVDYGGQAVYVGTEGGNLYIVPLDKFELLKQEVQPQIDPASNVQRETGIRPILDDVKEEFESELKLKTEADDDETTAVNLNDEPHIEQNDTEPFEMIRFETDVASQIGEDVKPKKQGAIESVKKHPASNTKLLISYHRGLSVIFDSKSKHVDKYFYHNQIIESSCFAGQAGDFFYTAHNDGSYIKWDTRKGNQSKADDDFLGQLYGPYPCKPMPKIQACTGLTNEQTEDLVIFTGGMPRATYDDKNPVTIVRAEPDGKDTIKTVLDFTSKVLDFAVITRLRGNLGAGAKSTSGSGGGGGGGKKGKNKQQQQKHQQRNQPIAIALAILAEEEFVVIDLLNTESYLEFPLPYLNCVQPSAITCNQHYSNIGGELYEQLLFFNKQQLKGKYSQNEWPITGGKIIDAPEVKSHDILLTGHEDGSVNIWDVSDLSMHHLINLSTSRFFSTDDDDLIDGTDNNRDNSPSSNNDTTNQDSKAWPPLKRVGKFDPYSDDTRLAVRRLSLCSKTGTLLVAGTGGQVLVFELKNEPSELNQLTVDEVTIVSDHRFTWKGRERLNARQGVHRFDPGYKLTSFVQMNPPASTTSTDLRSDWHVIAVGSSYGFLLYDYANKHAIVSKCTLNVQDFAIVSGDAGAMSRKKSFRKSLRESFRRLRRGRSQRNQPTPGAVSDQANTKQPFGRSTSSRALTAPITDTAQQAAAAHRNLLSGERQVEPKVELSSIIKCITLTSAVITSNLSCFKPSLWVGTNSGQVLVYAIDLASEPKPLEEPSVASSSGGDQSSDRAEISVSDARMSKTTAKLVREVQLKHKAPIIAIFTSPEAPQQELDDVVLIDSAKSTPQKQSSELFNAVAKSNGSDDQKQRVTSVNPDTNNDDTNQSNTERTSSPQPTMQSVDKSPSKSTKDTQYQQQPRVLICSEEQFKVFNLPNMKPFCKFKLTAHEGLRAKKISITQFVKPSMGNSKQLQQQSSSSATLGISKSLQSFATQTSPPASPVPNSGDSTSAANEQVPNGAQTSAKQTESNNNSLSALNNNHSSSNKQQDKELLNAKFGANKTNVSASSIDKTDLCEADRNSLEPFMVCMSNQGDCAIYSVPDLKRQAQIQVCKREDVNGITSAMLTDYGEGYYLKSSSNFLRFSISSQRVLRVLSVV